MANIGAVILAAGRSSRFGRPKQLVRFEGQTLLERAITAAIEGGCRPVVVVIGSDAAEIATDLASKSVSVVENRDSTAGIGTSIRAGVRHLSYVAPESNAVVLMVCDQPFVRAATVIDLITRWTKTGKSIVASSYSNTLGVPALFDSSCFGELFQLAGDRGAKPIIFADPERVAAVSFPEGACDIDTVADYDAIVRNELPQK
jgi:molybdenum cofactor cytidylyltransferase